MANPKKSVPTSPPSGLEIQRDGAKFKFRWKIAAKDHGAGQQLQYRIKKGDKWTDWKKLGDSVDIGKKTTAKTLTVDYSNYFPNDGKPVLNKVAFRVRGKRAPYTGTEKVNGKTVTYDYEPTWSDWTSEPYTVKEPKKPTVTATRTATNATKFAWSVDTNPKGARPFSRVVWDSVLVNNSNVTDGSKITFSSKDKTYQHGTGGASSSKTITETLDPTKSQTRWFRAWSQGASGNSKDDSGNRTYAYSKHIYAKPNQAKVTACTCSEKTTGYDCNVTFSLVTTVSKPTDEVVVQYIKSVPSVNHLNVPEDDNWQDVPSMGVTRKDTTYKTPFSVSGLLNNDYCLYVRVLTKHDENTVESEPFLVKSGRLSQPEMTSLDLINFPNVTLSATNTSQSPGSKVVGYMKNPKDPKSPIKLGTFGNDGTLTVNVSGKTGGASSSSLTFYARAEVSKTIKQNGKNQTWTITSTYDSMGGTVPVAPTDIVAQADGNGNINVSWTRTWAEATGTELSWSDREDAWASTKEPETYTIPTLYATSWKIAEIDAGKIWYVRVRLVNEDSTGTAYSDWSDITANSTVNLTYPPDRPVLNLSDNVILPGESFTAYWQYYNEDGTAQGSAVVQVMDANGALIKKAEVSSAQTVTFDSGGMDAGETYTIRLRVYSMRGVESDWSEVLTIKVAEELLPPEIMCSEEFDTVTVTEDGDEQTTDTVFALTALPAWVRMTGTGLKQIAIERAAPYHLERPDGDEFNGYEGETAYLSETYLGGQFVLTQDTEWDYTTQEHEESFTGDGENTVFTLQHEPYDGGTVSATVDNVAFSAFTVSGRVLTTDAAIADESVLVVTYETIYDRKDYFTKSGDDYTAVEFNASANPAQSGWYERQDETIEFSVDDLLVPLDDGASYRIVATLTDTYGQTQQTELPFEVHWEHQAIAPLGSEEIEDGVAVISPVAPQGWESGDVCDIYRLSADKPELIVQGGEFGQVYVDPYPTLGDNGGHRLVYRTSNGDYIDEDNTFAWLDLTQDNPSQYSIINFGGEELRLFYNVEASHGWSKDFKQTVYMGGSVQGDWNSGVVRTGTLGSVAITLLDNDEILAIRRLAAFPGICNVRTPDGSNFKADVQVSETRNHDNKWIVPSFTFDYTKVEPEELDGILYDDYTGEPEGET